MERFLREYPIPGKATFFLHDELPSLFDTEHELCPHPFIDDLTRWQIALSSVTARLPGQPKGMRAHSCVFSHMIAVGLNELGYRYVSQATCLFQAGLAPLRHPWGIWEMPIYYMDNMDFCMPRNWHGMGHLPFQREVIRMAVEEEGLFVFDFHPLHIALNTRDHSDYLTVKDQIINEGISPFELSFQGRGVRTFFQELCSTMQQHGIYSQGCWDALEKLGCNRS
jgi:hypothetical protein